MTTPTPKTFRVSDESINIYNLRVLTNGIDTTAFEQNPVMLFMHQRGQVFGEWAGLTVKDGQLFAQPVCDADSTNASVQEVASQVARGVLKAASIGITFKAEDVAHNEALQCYDILRCTLIEISIVDIPANGNAICLYSQAGEVLTQVQLSAQLTPLKPAPLPSTNTTPSMSQFKTLALAAGLGENASETEVQTAILNLQTNAGFKQKYEELLKENDSRQATLAADLVGAAVTDGRVPATMKENYLKLFKADHEGTAAILASLAKPQNLVTFASNGAAQSAASPQTDEEAKKAWDAHDKAGTLLTLQAGNKPEYDRLFKARFGKEPATK